MAYIGGRYTYDPLLTAGPLVPVYTCRLLFPDYDFSVLPTGTSGERVTVWFADEEYQTFLAQTSGDVVYATVLALQTAARNLAIKPRVSLGGGGEVDWHSAAAELRAQATALLEWYESLPGEAVAEVDWNDFNLRRIYANDALRSS